jgi:glycosyltransferase involved in cell wall biosynthesis
MYRKPAIIHFHEMQHAAYIFNPIANLKGLPKNITKIVSTWGSDLIYYSWSDKDSRKIEFCLEWTDLLTAERLEDFSIAKMHGYEKSFLAPVYITVGSEKQKQSYIQPCDRKVILVKGYQDNTGRALNVLEVLTQMSAELKDFEIRVFSASEPVRIQVDFMRNKLKMDIKVIPRVEKSVLKEMFKMARVYVGLAVSDGAPSSMIEAMESGCFPIQSQNSAGSHFISNAKTGFLVDPWNLGEVRKSISVALSDDELVNAAAIQNIEKLVKVYDLVKGKNRMKEIYSI